MSDPLTFSLSLSNRSEVTDALFLFENGLEVVSAARWRPIACLASPIDDAAQISATN
jgi:hypothetical protein